MDSARKDGPSPRLDHPRMVSAAAAVRVIRSHVQVAVGYASKQSHTRGSAQPSFTSFSLSHGFREKSAYVASFSPSMTGSMIQEISCPQNSRRRGQRCLARRTRFFQIAVCSARHGPDIPLQSAGFRRMISRVPHTRQRSRHQSTPDRIERRNNIA